MTTIVNFVWKRATLINNFYKKNIKRLIFYNWYTVKNKVTQIALLTQGKNIGYNNY